MAKSNTAVAQRADATMAEPAKGGIVAYLDSIKPKLEQAATRHMDPDRLIRVFLGIAARNRKIYDCTTESIVEALSLCNQTGLEPGGTLGHAYLIPRANKHNDGHLELNFQPGYKGLAELARRSGEVQRINAAPVYKWELDRGLFQYTHEPPDIRHDWVPDPAPCHPKDIVGAWAVAVLKDGMRVQVWLSREQIEKRKAKGSSSGGIWNEWYAEMCRKTALRALLNGGMVPISTELAVAMEHDPDSWTRDAAPSTTRAQRNIQVFQAGVTAGIEASEAIDAAADVVDPETGEVLSEEPSKPGNPYAEAIVAARESGATPKEIKAAMAQAGVDKVPPGEFTIAHGDSFLTALEQAKDA